METQSLATAAPRRSRNAKRWTTLGVGIVGLLVLGACLPVSGGGYISGVDGGKANFGFNITCNTSDPNNPHLTGPWNYNDKSTGTNIAGDMSSTFNGCGNPLGSSVQIYSSTYTVQGKCTTVCTGEATISIYDSGNNGGGSMKGDCLGISLSSSGYQNPPGATSTGGCPAPPTVTVCSNNGCSEVPVGPPLTPVLGGNLKVGG